MESPESRTASNRGSLLALFLAVALFASPQAANAYLATEITQMMNQLQLYMQQLQTKTEFVATNKARLDQLREYQRQATKLMNFFDTMNLPVDMRLEERPETYNMKERCRTEQMDFSIGAVISVATPKLTEDLKSQQDAICQRIVIMENRKYNELVTMVNSTKTRQQELARLTKNLKTSDEPGAVAANQAQAQVVMNRTLSEMQYSTSKIQAYDGMIAALSADQKTLAAVAMKGQPSILGTVFKTTALEMALRRN